jgi:hypothetical protein
MQDTLGQLIVTQLEVKRTLKIFAQMFGIDAAAKPTLFQHLLRITLVQILD